MNEEDWEYAKRKGVHIFPMTEIEEKGLVSIIEEALQLAWNGTDGVYLSFDIDALDPCHAPGTGSPTFGGLTSKEVLKAVGIITNKGLVGFDLVEVIPNYDLHDMTSTLAARIIVEVLATCAFKARNKINKKNLSLGGARATLDD